MQKILMNADFSSNLRRLRDQAELSQYELVRELSLAGSKLSRESYAKIELGIRNIKVSDLVALQKIYKVDFSEFFKGIDVC